MLKEYTTRDDEKIFLDLSKAAKIEKFDYLSLNGGIEKGWHVYFGDILSRPIVLKGISEDEIYAAVREAKERYDEDKKRICE